MPRNSQFILSKVFLYAPRFFGNSYIYATQASSTEGAIYYLIPGAQARMSLGAGSLIAEDQLNEKGVRFWRDAHHATAGPLEKQIDVAIRHNPTVLLVLSEHSTKSDWVEHEVRTARELTKELGRHVLCPVALDDSWKSTPWPKRLMEQIMEYNILDFSEWEDQNVFEKQFKKLLDGLDLFYK